MSDFKDKIVIVTGGARGIGGGISRAFAEEGANVLCADLDEDSGAQLVEESSSMEGTVRFLRADVAHGSECQGVVETAVSEWGGVDVLCATTSASNLRIATYPAHEFPEEMWDRIIDVNLKSFFLMTKYCVPEMKKRGGGAIINTASVQGLQSMLGVSAYAASKGGALSLTRQLALEYAEDNIRGASGQSRNNRHTVGSGSCGFHGRRLG